MNNIDLEKEKEQEEYAEWLDAMYEATRDAEEPLPEGYCPGCGSWVEAIMQDYGIGSYEYWGSRGTHTDLRCVCPKCEEEVEEGLESFLCNSCLWLYDDLECAKGQDAEQFDGGLECPLWEGRLA